MIFRILQVSLTAVVLLWIAKEGYAWQQALEQPSEQAISSEQSGELEAAPQEEGKYAVNAPSNNPTSQVENTGLQLVFPVEQHDLSHVISAYGDPRGNRLHQGIDIKAERGTPIVAVTSGFIERVKEGGNGGKQIYLRGADGRLFYYAHLEDWEVEEMEAVQAGQLIGSVGNSGNASNTTPHLHFEVLLGQDRDAVDPTPYFSPNS
ncbi:MAG: M23 family metallopeptidase [Bacteroidota bacterium]